MYPILKDFGTWNLPGLGPTHLFLPTYGVVFAAAVLLAWTWFLRRGRALGVAEEPLFNLTFYSLLGGIVGAKLLLIAVDWRTYVEHPRELWGSLRSAGVLLGGVAAGAAVFYGYARRRELPVWALADAIAAPLALAQGIGRLGCFAAGCCWGRACDPHNPLAVTFTDPAAAANTGVPLGIPLIATQPLQAAHDLALAGLLTWLWRRRPQPAGTVFWCFLLLYSLGRGTIELWRGDEHRGIYFGGLVSTSQLLAAAAAALATAMLLRGGLQRRSAQRR
ncbi:MAG TPA: prolipoprotein diacylglyceryl transferase family protein [Candidatus Polarisedimenticolaceae bacterium]|nr:prolipoprotein diacylglyceryl transferase family protein [Candidatus Polarisedimenticolaceae bacterium]